MRTKMRTKMTTKQKYTDLVEFANGNSVETYRGRVYADGDNITIECLHGYADLTSLLYRCNIAYLCNTTKLERGVMEGLHLARKTELVPVEEDYQSIADIYKRLAKLAIVVESCTFVRHEGCVMMQLPIGITMYRKEGCAKRTRDRYINEGLIKKSIPNSMNYEKLLMTMGVTGIKRKLSE